MLMTFYDDDNNNSNINLQDYPNSNVYFISRLFQQNALIGFSMFFNSKKPDPHKFLYLRALCCER